MANPVTFFKGHSKLGKTNMSARSAKTRKEMYLKRVFMWSNVAFKHTTTKTNSQLAKDAKVSPRTIKNWITVLKKHDKINVLTTIGPKGMTRIICRVAEGCAPTVRAVMWVDLLFFKRDSVVYDIKALAKELGCSERTVKGFVAKGLKCGTIEKINRCGLTYLEKPTTKAEEAVNDIRNSPVPESQVGVEGDALQGQRSGLFSIEHPQALC